MAVALSPTDLLVAENVGAALKIGAGFDWKAAIAAFESGSTQQKVVDGLIAADDIAKIVGLFVPPVAVIANDVGIAISLEEVVYSLVQWLRTQPTKPPVSASSSVWTRIKSLFLGA